MDRKRERPSLPDDDEAQADRHPIRLSVDQWNALDLIAMKTESVSISGPKAGKASWRTLIRRIADGDLIVLPKPRD